MAAIRETIDLIETDLAAMIRDVQRAADAVRGGTRATADVLGAIRGQSDSLETLAGEATGNATTSRDRHRGVRAVVRRDRPAGARSRLADRGCRPRRGGRGQERRRTEGVIGRDRQCRQPDLGDCEADQPARAQRHHRGGARGRCGTRLCGGGQRGEGALERDAERHGRNRPQDRSVAARRAGVDRGGQSHHDGDRRAAAGVRRRRERHRAADRDDRRAVAQRVRFLALRELGRRERERDQGGFRARRSTAAPRSTARARMPRTLRRSCRRASSPSCARPRSATGGGTIACPAICRCVLRQAGREVRAQTADLSEGGMLVRGGDIEKLSIGTSIDADLSGSRPRARPRRRPLIARPARRIHRARTGHTKASCRSGSKRSAPRTANSSNARSMPPRWCRWRSRKPSPTASSRARRCSTPSTRRSTAPIRSSSARARSMCWSRSCRRFRSRCSPPTSA